MEFLSIILFIILIGISFIIYFLPSIIGYKHRNSSSIILLNLFLGWTLVGWIIAMLWAVSAENKSSTLIVNKKSLGDELKQLSDLHKSGSLTDQEFEAEKKFLLRK